MSGSDIISFILAADIIYFIGWREYKPGRTVKRQLEIPIEVFSPLEWCPLDRRSHAQWPGQPLARPSCRVQHLVRKQIQPGGWLSRATTWLTAAKVASWGAFGTPEL